MKILHLSTDNIFLDNALEQFEFCYPNSNQVIIWSENSILKKIKTKWDLKIVDSLNVLIELVDVNVFDLIVLHSLNVQNANFINNIKFGANQKVIWMLHGYEVYTLSKFNSNDIYSDKTKIHFIPKHSAKKLLKEFGRPIFEKILKTDNKSIIQAARKVNYLGILYIEEYKQIRDKLGLKAEWFQFTYYPLEKIVPEKSTVPLDEKNNILVGNSANESNNHIDVFDKLKKIGLLEKQNIICPLSYGNKCYADALIVYGKECFDKNFSPLVKFMPIEDYNKITASCSLSIMNHYRQQAAGTVLAMVYSGSKVFLSTKNTLFHYLIRIGVTVFSIEEDLKTKADLFPLNKTQQDKNRDIIYYEINQNDLLIRLKQNLINLL